MAEINVSNCLICNGLMRVVLFGLWDNRFASRGEYYIMICKQCGLFQTAPIPEYHELIDLYGTYYNFGSAGENIYAKLRRYYFNSSAYKCWTALDGDISFYMSRGRGRLLDVGCNEGRALVIHRQNGFEPEGIEINEVAACEAKDLGFIVHLEPLERFHPTQLYEIIVLSNVIEHLLSPKELLGHIKHILKPDGQIWISCPNVNSWQRKLFGKYWINWHVPFHIVHFSQSTLINILQEAGLEIQEIKQKSPALWVAQSIIVRLFSKPGKPTNYLRSPILVVSLMLLARVLLFPLLWLGNFLGRGDCLVIKAKKKSI